MDVEGIREVLPKKQMKHCCHGVAGWLVTVLLFAVLPVPWTGAAPLLLSHFRFEGDGRDDLGNSPPMDLSGVSFTNGTLSLPPEFFTASARITGFSYSSFTVAFDFKPLNFGYPHSTFLSGGPSYRWIGFENDSQGHLHLTLNNSNRRYAFTNVLESNRWHTVVCAVDLPSQQIVTFLDGQQLPDIVLAGFQFEVVGTALEEWDKVFSFWNDGDGSHFAGFADNLRVYRRALSPAEILSLHSARLSIEPFPGSVRIYWSADLTDYVLESADSLRPPTAWTTETGTPIFIGREKVIVENGITGVRFYRLRRL